MSAKRSRYQDMTDNGLIRAVAGGAPALSELVRRFPEFIVRDQSRGFVASVDQADGDTAYTTDPGLARIFSGAEWVRCWCRDGVDFWQSAEQARRNNIPAVNTR